MQRESEGRGEMRGEEKESGRKKDEIQRGTEEKRTEGSDGEEGGEKMHKETRGGGKGGERGTEKEIERRQT